MHQLNHLNLSSYGPFLVKLVLFFVSLFLFTKLAGPLPFTVKNISSGVSDVFTISGEGKVTIKPDVAVVNLGVNADGKTVKEAQDKINLVANQVLDQLKQIGIDPKDIKTQSYNIYPTYDFDKPSQKARPVPPTNVPVSPVEPSIEVIDQSSRITGYHASTTISVKIKDSQKVNQVIDSATTSGANQIGGVTFEAADKTEAENEARKKAIEDAKKKAQEAAKVAGFRLGKMVSYFENLSPPPTLGDVVLEKAEVVDTNIRPGSMEVVVNVTLNYEIR